MMKVAIYQGPEFAQDVQSNLDTLAIQANQAAAQGARLLIAPEMFLTGCNISPDSIPPIVMMHTCRCADRRRSKVLRWL